MRLGGTEKAGAVDIWTTWFITDWGNRKERGALGLAWSGLGLGSMGNNYYAIASVPKFWKVNQRRH
jgi:hypothetical protein